jgi:hypothetical protein
MTKYWNLKSKVTRIESAHAAHRWITHVGSRAAWIVVCGWALLACEGTISANDSPDTGSIMDAAARDGAIRFDAAIESPPFRTDLRPNRWELIRTELPQVPWESSITYDPRTRSVYRHGGHGLGSYAQASYTWRYSLLDDVVSMSLSPTRPPRRCIIEQTYVDSLERVLTVQGTQNHGSMPVGKIAADGRSVIHTESVGPWLYDAVADTWDQTRTLDQNAWPKRLHTTITYDSTSDAVYGVGGDALHVYSPHANRVIVRALPEALHGRLHYAMAFDPGTRRLVVFGGSVGSYYWGALPDASDDCNPSTPQGLAQCQMNYAALVRSDTWIYEVDSDAWHEATPAMRPPTGMPGTDFLAPRLVYHPPSGRLVLHQVAVDHFEPDWAQWPPTELWAFDAASESWELIPTEEPVAFTGLLTYAAGEDVLVLWGGGRDGGGRPAVSRNLYMMRLVVPGAPVLAPPEPRRVESVATGSGPEIRWDAEPGATYEIARALASPTATVYMPVGTASPSDAQGRWVDSSAAMADAHAYRVRRSGTSSWSLPAFDRPGWPGHVVATTQSANHVRIGWDEVTNEGVVGYHVYRARWGESAWTRLTTDPVAATTFDDLSPELSDGIVRVYHVTTFDRDGRESGRSAAAYSFPDAPPAFRVEQLEGGRAIIRWSPTDPEHDRIQVWYQDFHCNAQGAAFDPYLNGYALIGGGPMRGGEITVDLPVIDPTVRSSVLSLGCSSVHDGHYYYARVVNELGQMGFWSDIVSTTNEFFTAARHEP